MLRRSQNEKLSNQTYEKHAICRLFQIPFGLNNFVTCTQVPRHIIRTSSQHRQFYKKGRYFNNSQSHL